MGRSISIGTGPRARGGMPSRAGCDRLPQRNAIASACSRIEDIHAVVPSHDRSPGPFLRDARAGVGARCRMRVDIGSFDKKYRSVADPWRFATSPYELHKYHETVSALGARHFRRAFEPGCAIGVLTLMLADHADHIVAVDASERAIGAARRRLAGRGHVELHVGAIPEWWPEGTFDLVVFSELGYYWDRDGLDDVVARIVRLLDPGGVLLAVHWLGSSGDHLCSGYDVHERLEHHVGPSTTRVEYGSSSRRDSMNESFLIEQWAPHE